MPAFTLSFTPAQADAIRRHARSLGYEVEEYLQLLALEAVEPPSVTIKEVAKVARVSPMAVSFTLNNVPGQVSEKNQKRIRAVAKKLGWRPSVTAKSLRKKGR